MTKPPARDDVQSQPPQASSKPLMPKAKPQARPPASKAEQRAYKSKDRGVSKPAMKKR